jgi:hypothetical protein
MIDLKKIWNKIKIWPWGCMIMTLLCLFWLYRAFSVAYFAWIGGYMTFYFDCEPAYDIETFNKFIKEGLIYGCLYLFGFIYFLHETIKNFKQK